MIRTQPKFSRREVESADHGTRREILRRLGKLMGNDAVSGWLARPQPAFDDQTPARLMQTDPARLLRHLVLLDTDADTDHEGLFDPDNEHFGCRRTDRDARGLMAILDELEGGSP